MENSSFPAMIAAQTDTDKNGREPPGIIPQPRLPGHGGHHMPSFPQQEKAGVFSTGAQKFSGGVGGMFCKI
jgi:hypothetical protein